MKKHLLIVFLVCIGMSMYGQTAIPNGNFEAWDSATCENPQGYANTSNPQNFFRGKLPFNVVKTKDAYHGSYAVQLSTIAVEGDTSVAFFMNIDPEGGLSSWTGGIPYNQKPTGIRGYYKLNAATDSGTLVVAFSKEGINIHTYLITIGGIKDTFTLFEVPFNPALELTPDSVIFGVVSCKLSIEKGEPAGLPGTVLILDSVSFTGVTSQPELFNGDFELWKSSTYNIPENWYIDNDSYKGFSKTTDSYAGKYAVNLKTYSRKGREYAIPGKISNGYYGRNCNNDCNQMGGFPFVNKVDTLAFCYKYNSPCGDSVNINLYVKKDGIFILKTGMDLPASASYQYAEFPFSLEEIPDSIIIQIESSEDTLMSCVGSDLTIDELHFKTKSYITGIQTQKSSGITIIPNPSNGNFQIRNIGNKVQRVEIYNTSGIKIYERSVLTGKTSLDLDISYMPKGMYLIKMFEKGLIRTEKIMIK